MGGSVLKPLISNLQWLLTPLWPYPIKLSPLIKPKAQRNSLITTLKIILKILYLPEKLQINLTILVTVPGAINLISFSAKHKFLSHRVSKNLKSLLLH